MMKWRYFLISLLFSNLLFGQSGNYNLNSKVYPFIKYEQNLISFPGDSNILNNFHATLDSIVLYGKGNLNIVHIGGSHIQADLYTHVTRKNLQSLQYDAKGSRGLIFPFNIAKTNNPWNYKVEYTGNWNYCKNTQSKRYCSLGLTGMAITTSDNHALIFIDPNNDGETSYSFNRVKVFHPETGYSLFIENSDSLYTGVYNHEIGATVFNIADEQVLQLEIKKDSLLSEFTLLGISLENDNPGITYHSIGVNGAKLKSYYQSEYYQQHITAIHPDLVIFSIGTNDANTRYFNQERFIEEYQKLISITKEKLPNTAIMITVPNDCYLYKKYVNPNTVKMRNEIVKLAARENYVVWDLYSIMGGLNSSLSWYRYGLMKFDRIHFNRDGYILKGNLFTTALLRDWEKNLDSRLSKYNIYTTDHDETSSVNNP